MLNQLRIAIPVLALVASFWFGVAPAMAQPCANDGAGFDRWIGQYKAEATKQARELFERLPRKK